MTDYRLEGLSTRTFEHLVQSLVHAAITTTATPFGDGPDGGREATFEGATSYGPATQQWNGYGIVQAKFLQRPKDSKNDGEWIVSQVRKELEDLESRPARIADLDYYIIASNVTLTPSEKTGSKDKMRKLLNEFKVRNNLKEFDVWDYDKMRVLLDIHKEVAQAYSAWITSGDVLNALIEQIGRGPDHYTSVVRFLQKEMLADQYSKLEQAGHSADEKIPLAQVFVDLATIDQEPSDRDSTPPNTIGFVREMVNVAGEKLTVGQLSDDSRQRPRVKTPGRYVLIGGPGQGKTTVGQFLCQVFRVALLRDVDTYLLDSASIQAVDSITAQWSPDDIGARRLPLRVVLSELAAALGERTANSLLDYIAQRFSKAANTTYSVSELELLLRSYPCLIVLDGLDEVPASSNRSEVLLAVQEFWVDMASAGIDALMVATSRPQGYNEDFSMDHYEHRWLVPLSPEVALDYGSRLAHVRFGAEDRYEKIIDRLRRAIENPATARLTKSPLQVTILTLIVDRMGQPPQERWALFSEYYRIIYQRETERDIEAAEVLRVHKPDIDAIHKRVGLLLQLESENSGTTDARLSSQQFADLVDSYLVSEGHEGEARVELRNRIIDGAANRLVFLVGLESDRVGFEIRSLQEFMAAEGLMELDDATTHARLRQISAAVSWRNVFLFAAGKCFAERRYLRDVIQSICADLNEDPDDPLSQHIRAGSVLALDLLADGSALRQPAKYRALARLAFRVLDLPASLQYANRLAEAFVPGSDDLFAEELEQRLNSDASESKRGASVCLVELLSVTPTSQFAKLAERYLTDSELTNSRVATLSRTVSGRSSWMTERLSPIIEHLNPEIFVDDMMFDDYVGSSDQLRDVQPWVLDKMPAWADSMLRALYAQYWSDEQLAIAVTGANGRKVGQVQFESLLLYPESRFRNIAGKIPRTMAWEPVHQWFAFLANPNSGNLTKILGHFDNDQRDQLLLTVSELSPWPLSSSLLEIFEGADSQEVIGRILQGSMGDVAVWRRAEDHWRTNGIALSDYLERFSSISEGEGWRGFPIAGSRFYGAGSQFSVEEIHKAYGSADEGWTKEYLGGILTGAMLEFSQTLHTPVAGIPWWTETVQELISRRWRTSTDTLLLAPDNVNSEQWVEALLSYDLSDAPFYARNNVVGLQRLTRAAVAAKPNDQRLLVPLAFLAQNSEVQDLFPYRGLSAAPDAPLDLRLADLLVQARSGISIDRLDITLVRAASLEAQTADHSIVAAIQARALKVEEEQRLLLELRERFCQEGFSLEAIDRALRMTASRRLSNLQDRNKWRDLKMPDEIVSFLTRPEREQE